VQISLIQLRIVCKNSCFCSKHKEVPKNDFKTIACDPEDPLTQSLIKISKISSAHFVAFKCGVCVPNISSIASKLCEEIEVTYRWTDDNPNRCMLQNLNLMKNARLIMSNHLYDGHCRLPLPWLRVPCWFFTKSGDENLPAWAAGDWNHNLRS